MTQDDASAPADTSTAYGASLRDPARLAREDGFATRRAVSGTPELDSRRVLEPTADARIIAGRYRVLRTLGEGALAQTFACEDLQEQRTVAVKELRLERVDNWKHVELFHREAQVLKLVSHPGVPRVFDGLERETDGRAAFYLVQELVEGRSLREHVELGPLLGEDDIVRIADGVLEILAHLHGRIPPVYHRDIKPSNIMVRPDGSPVLIDFGGVCFGWRAPDKPGTTVVGTFGYMPPEQLLGQVGPRTDLYALGATLLHVVSGVPPHEFSFDTGRIEVPKDLPIRPALRDLIGALLEPAPRDRPASAAVARNLLGAGARAPGSAIALVSAPTSMAMPAGDAPQFVDLGPPPRDPNGPFSDVYRVLVDPLNELRSQGSAAGKAAAMLWLGILALVTIGILPMWWASDRKQRRQRYEPLFRDGDVVRGTIAAVTKGSDASFYATFKYEYDVDGVHYRGFIHYPESLVPYLGPGDPVAVLYDAHEPADSCFVYRPSDRGVRGRAGRRR
jgi:tRNA A-37 threonylcarbamoyl transferase component Bud32